MYKKFASIFLMVSLSLIIFNISHAATLTFEEGKYQVYMAQYSNSSSYESNFADLENKSPNEVSSLLPDLIVSDDIVENYPYQIFVEYNGHHYYVFSNSPFGAKRTHQDDLNNFLLNGYIQIRVLEDSTVYKYTLLKNSTSWTSSTSEFSSGGIVVGASFLSPIYYANHQILNCDNGTIVYPSANVEEKPSMQNPLTNEEILSLVDELLVSEAVKNRPDDYDKLFIQYDGDVSAYFAFFYPNDAILEGTIKPKKVSGLESDVYFISGTQKTSFWEDLFDGYSHLNFTYYVLWKGTYENAPTWNFYDHEYKNNMNFRNLLFDCITQPIVYTSHDIRFLYWETTEIDGVNSLPATGLKDEDDNTVDVILPEAVETSNVFMFAANCFRVILALFNVLVRFIAFITTLMAIPADSSLLLPEFVQGIDWIKALDINGISIFAFFQISIIIAFGIGVVKFIKEAFAE